MSFALNTLELEGILNYNVELDKMTHITIENKLFIVGTL